MQVVQATGTVAEAISGSFILGSVSGDITPDPAPGTYPITAGGSRLGATSDVMTCPLEVYPTNLSAMGKAAISLSFVNHLGNAVAPQCAAGIIFSKQIPAVTPLVFSDVVSGAITANTETQLGTITISEKATRLVGIKATLMQDGVLVTAEELIGTIRIASDDVDLTPGQFPFSAAHGAGLGALITGGMSFPTPYIALDSPLEGGSRIDCFAILNTAVTNAASAQVAIAYV